MGIIVRQSIKGTVVNYLGSFIGFIMTFFIMIKYLTPAEVGLTRVLLDVALLLAGIASLGTNASIIRFYPYFKNQEKRDHGFFFWTLLLPLVGFLIVLACYLIFKENIIGFFIKESPLFVEYSNFVIPLAFFLMYIAVFETNSNVLMRIVIPKFIREVVIRLMLVCVYLCYAFNVFTQHQFIIAFCAVYGVALLLNIFYMFSLGKVSLKPDIHYIDKGLAKNIGNYTLFLVIASLASTITPMINTIFISGKMGLDSNGIFAVATYIAAIIEIPYRSLGAITQPQISHAIKDNDAMRANTLCKSVSFHQLLIGSLIFFFIWINIDAIFDVIPNGDFYKAGKWAVCIIGLSRLFNSAFSVGTTVLNFSKYYYYSLIFSFGLTVLAIFLNLKLIPVWGILGAAMATLISYLVYYLFLLGLSYIKLKISPFSKKQLTVVLLVAILFLLNYLWNISLSPLILKINANQLFLTILDRGLCSILLAGIVGVVVYKFKFSDEIHGLIEMGLDKTVRRRKGK
ncbi:oligosaccharide flippase family protein [Bacteroidales bacterium OttesenSCG-928-B11]|nr:oligosaccharide flippase family protein [Bacteroidales bacterium OttesenSCG-928-C03]MDL2312230.1 oligosaccharide flippase family protein [Bacteroidales bacterium OttesenSCG-928-B11]MDL2326951.1 oligosaccharide flippase family protein [Bacteroidales bacterium OttesenSCG-928-A14]